jgi:hypothetical protein
VTRPATDREQVIARIEAALAAPKTHRVVTAYASGATRTHETRSLAAAENWATGERRKIGKDLIDRTSGKPVMVTSVEIHEIHEIAK